MTRCCPFGITEAKNWYYRFIFTKLGLQSTTTDLTDGTRMHCWVPNSPHPSKPNLLLVHGLGVNALWQWGDVIHHFTPYFQRLRTRPRLLWRLIHHSARSDRVLPGAVRVMESNSVRKMSVVGLSYGGFVGYSTMIACY